MGEVDEVDGILALSSPGLPPSSFNHPEIVQLFNACDLDGSGYISEEELASICNELSPHEIKDVFRELDKDGDGKISMSEFAEGFADISETLLNVTRLKRRRLSSERRNGEIITNKETEQKFLKFLSGIDEGFGALSCQEHVCDLYQQLHSAELPHLLAQFENIILAVIRDIRQHQVENERLEKSYKREKDQHSRHLRQMEEEMEVQMTKVEQRVRKEEKERSESERDELKKQLELEIKELQSNLTRLQKLDNELHRAPDEEMKTRISELTDEGRQLKSSLTDAQTNLALVRSELATVRQQYEEKCMELRAEKETLVEYIKEQDNLTRQVHLLHDANQKLHDTNDDLRSALDARTNQKRPYIGMSPYSHGDPYMSPMVNFPPRSRARARHQSIDMDYSHSPRNEIVPYGHFGPCSASSSLAEELSTSFDPYMRRLLPAQESCEVDSIAEDIGTLRNHDSEDSGHSTLRDSHDVDSEYEPNSIEDDIPYTPRSGRHHREFDSTTESEMPESQDEDDMDDDHEPLRGQSSGVDTEIEDAHPSRPGSNCSRSSRGSLQRASFRRRQLPNIPMPQKVITGEPERMYKIVLAGDAAVGKSSFILRLCKDKFVNNLNSTLGVDFQTKTLEVDGRVIALQLWDTAGQERFRSIAKSYFRRADGVLLLYDCTYERSYINVRDWINAIEDGAQKKIPIMICGNKTDLRDDYVHGDRKGLVRYEDGQKLAKQVDALFIETSAKDGSNIHAAVLELARILRTNEDLDIKAAGMKLQDLKTGEGKNGMKNCC